MAKKPNVRIVHRDMNMTEKSISLVLFILLIIFVYLSSPFSRIQGVTVSTVGNVTPDKIIADSKLKVNDYYFETLFFQDNITKRIIQANPKIKNVYYDLKNNNQLVLQIEEHAVIGLIIQNEQIKALLSNGNIIDDYVQSYRGSVTEILWNGNEESLIIFVNEFAKVNELIREKISNIVYFETDLLNVTFYMKDGNQVKVSYTEFYEKLNYYDDYLKHTRLQKGVFDLTVGVFFSPYQR